MEYKSLESNDKRLRAVCSDVRLDELKEDEVQLEIDGMLDFVYGNSNKGESRNSQRPMTVGLSANQVGILKKICIVDLAIGNKKYSDIYILINPVLVWHSEELIQSREGCVNFPEVWGLINRYEKVRVEALSRFGSKVIIEAEGLAATVLQHEIDHINGDLFIDKLDDSTHAHFVPEDQTALYRENFKTWDQFIDMSTFVVNKSKNIN